MNVLDNRDHRCCMVRGRDVTESSVDNGAGRAREAERECWQLQPVGGKSRVVMLTSQQLEPVLCKFCLQQFTVNVGVLRCLGAGANSGANTVLQQRAPVLGSNLL